MAKARAASVAASSQFTGDDGIRQPAGEVHAWTPGMNQTLCGLALSRTRLRTFPHVKFDFRATDVVTAEDEVRYVCPRCVAATSRRGERSWTRTAPRP
ncbi:hypothetical protein AMIS_42420 [Actinoplanes missouriensis 431]|uniref:Uncharacterized protein n=1 Tax=Actinoplanes missouriensis (strain ATCC 14538 / DSM 43046 / CBS 188.64 / JCM 3121 / NBRC 102363 / NCIMB 12654 / NRRL B-3342 / UNCC 431) TaxID=512565 RepID=I0H8X5_ACTM4|nr:hypothetical protein [Actinoplanes missouriensis]BAL89462.1 hypothetical protein AMIS_42420 [Actinoplanes missouriensis 431]